MPRQQVRLEPRSRAQTAQTRSVVTWYRVCNTTLGMMDTSDELRDRVEARKHELLAKYNDLKADSRHEAAEARTRLKARLEELELHLKAGWAKVNADVRSKINDWLDRKD
jgi:hypothetical protein